MKYFVPDRMVNDAQLRNRRSLACVATRSSYHRPKMRVDETIVDAKMRVLPLRKVRNSDLEAAFGRHSGDGLTLL